MKTLLRLKFVPPLLDVHLPCLAMLGAFLPSATTSATTVPSYDCTSVTGIQTTRISTRLRQAEVRQCLCCSSASGRRSRTKAGCNLNHGLAAGWYPALKERERATRQWEEGSGLCRLLLLGRDCCSPQPCTTVIEVARAQDILTAYLGMLAFPSSNLDFLFGASSC